MGTLATSRLRLSLLGGFDCRSPTGEVVRFPTRRVRALLAYLAMRAGQASRRDKCAALLWGERRDQQARTNLRKALSQLRHALPPDCRDCLAADGNQLMIGAAGLELDVAVFERCAADGTPETLERTSTVYRGPFLEGFGECGEELEEWMMAERRRLEETLHRTLQRLLDHYVVTGAIDRAIQVALRLLALDPLQEGVHRALMRLYMHQDRVGAALEQYRRCREILSGELGVEPAADTQRVRAELLRLGPSSKHDREASAERETDDLPERVTVAQTAAQDRTRRRAQATGRPSITVLSFAEAPDETTHGHLGDGIAEDITTELGRFRELDVIAPTTALAYGEAAVAPERIGDELGTDYVLDGRLRETGNGGVRITVRLVETDTARQVWAERYDCSRAEMFDIEDDVVRRIVGCLIGRIEDARLEAAQRKRPQDWQAYELWLRGWSTLKRSELSAIREARGFFEKAIAKDPYFARAYVGLALAHLNEWACYSWNHWFFVHEQALQLARKAVELDDCDHRAHCMLGLTQLYGRDYEGARRRLLKALELNPNDADVLAHASVGMALIGEHELAVATGRHALRLAPHHPEWYAGVVGIALFAARLHEEAIETMAPAPEAICNTPAFIAASYAHLGQKEHCASHRDTVYRHYRHQMGRGAFPKGTGCVDWLLALDPFQRSADVEHYAEGLREAGFE